MSNSKISIILPTRKRTDALVTSLNSLITTASNSANLEILIAYDDDDEESKTFFAEQWADYISQCDATSKIFETERFGYTKLNEYLNILGDAAEGDWIFFWNDDALMLTDNWDKEVLSNNPEKIQLLRIPCSTMEHPFALMPIFPRKWIDLFGMISPVSHSDWWIYNVTKPLNLVKDINALFYHDRADVTGGNNDETFKERSYSADGKDKTNPYDYIHPDRQRDLLEWIQKLQGASSV